MTENTNHRITDLDDESSHYSPATSSAVFDEWDDFTSRFTLDYQADCTLKLRHYLNEDFVVGTDFTHSMLYKKNMSSLVLKPANGSRWWRRVRIGSDGTLTLRCPKLRWWLFALDLHGHVNPVHRTTNASFHFTVDPMNLALGKTKNKKCFQLGDNAETRIHWSVSSSLPEIQGNFATSGQNVETKEVHTDVGYAHVHIPRVELVVWPFKLEQSE